MHVRDLCNVAGALTFSRLAVATGMPWFIHHDVGLAAYAVAIATDVVDGAVARRTGTSSPAGAAFDGWVDKILHVNLGWTLALDDRMPDWFMLCWCSREILQLVMIPILIHRFRVERGPLPGTSVFGRATACLLALCVVLVLLGYDATIPTIATGIAGVLAGLHYAWIHLGSGGDRISH